MSKIFKREKGPMEIGNEVLDEPQRKRRKLRINEGFPHTKILKNHFFVKKNYLDVLDV